MWVRSWQTPQHYSASVTPSPDPADDAPASSCYSGAVDYLQETNPAFRWLAALALGLAARHVGLLALGGAVACVVVDFPKRDGVSPRGPMAAAFGLVACFTGTMARRLASVGGRPMASYAHLDINGGLVGRLARAKRREAAVMRTRLVRILLALVVVAASDDVDGTCRRQADPHRCRATQAAQAVMTLEELDRVWQGKDFGQACGGITDKAGRDRAYFRNVYNLVLPGSPLQTMSFRYIQDQPDGQYTMYKVTGPGFTYELRNGKYVAVEGPPKR